MKKAIFALGILLSSAMAFGQANTTLSNLSGTTAVNQDFFPDSTANGRAMGDFDHFWGALYGGHSGERSPSWAY